MKGYYLVKKIKIWHKIAEASFKENKSLVFEILIYLQTSFSSSLNLKRREKEKKIFKHNHFQKYFVYEFYILLEMDKQFVDGVNETYA